MNKSFHPLEQAVDRIEERFPGVPRQQVILTRLYFHILPRLTGYLNDGMKEYGLNESLWMSLLAMYACPHQSLYPSDISDTLDSSRTNATRIVDELVRHGWATRIPCAADRRKIGLELTQQGLELVESLLPVSRANYRALWSDFDPEEMQLMEKMMRKLLARLGG
ncbi:MarR family transcriptional regulator [Aquitalea sp. LB_tupeE]|uniref:MarR family transcriptional regulator n=1 Tax=Aquitalea sp. LB_tupeE TaxID=2748078 RepID=UPI0015BDD2FD|nr:MarR family transcriptional regulator [Aquitalea sp. LB_tupeE]NWK78095.1 MarR family transcriptional regulator [Aquitalea sp. LB_tupeE]